MRLINLPVLLSMLTTSLAGYAIVNNNCDFTLFLYSAGGSPGPEHPIPAKGFYTEPYRRDPVSGGVAIKMLRVSQGLYNASSVTQFDYTLDGAAVWYDLAAVYGSSLKGFKVVQAASDPNCPGTVWPTGEPNGSPVNRCDAAANVTVTACAA